MRRINTLVIGTLYFNKTLYEFERNLQRMIQHVLKNSGIVNLHIITQNGAAVDMARNNIATEALVEFNADAVVWLDTDMLYPDHAITRLVQMSNAGHGIAAGIYRRARQEKQILAGFDWDTYATLDEMRAQAREDGLVRMMVAAGGFSIVRNEVYQAVPVPWYCNWDFVTGKRQIGEDRFFLLRAAEAGYSPVVDPELHALHWPPQTGPVPVLPNDPLLRYCE